MQPLLSQAVVTGGNSGIGAETVRALAAAGARVILTSRDPSAGQAVADRLQEEAHGLKVRYRARPRAEKVQGSFSYATVVAHSSVGVTAHGDAPSGAGSGRSINKCGGTCVADVE